MIFFRLILKIGLAALAIIIVDSSVYSVVIQRDTSYTTYQTWKKIQKKYPEAKIPPTVTNPNLVRDLNVIYTVITDSATKQKRELCLDIFRPKKRTKCPVLLLIHGGGWRSGDKSMEAPMAQHIAAHGYVVVPVEYRLSLEDHYPAAVQDIIAAICWVKRHADTFNVDTTRIAIAGNSAGGQLAALVAMTSNVRKFESDSMSTFVSSKVNAAINIDGPVDFLSPASLNIPRKPNSADVFWLGGTFEEKPLVWKEASPIFWINEHSVPILFIASSQPRFHAGRDEMIDLLNQYHIYNESYTIPNTPHSFWLYEPWLEPTVKYMIRFLDKVFNYN